MGLLIQRVVIAAAIFCTIYEYGYSQDTEEAQYYERCSLHTMMIVHKNQKYSDVVEKAFKSVPFPERFNDHNLGVKSVVFAETSSDMSSHIELFCEEVNMGQKMVAKWFNRNKQTGTFNMDLVWERGFYNASQADVNIARSSMRGIALLLDAGENLIGNTYLLVNDIIYQSKGTSAAFLKMMAAAYASGFTGSVELLQNEAGAIGGFDVKVKSYLFRLVWNDDVAATFYYKYYTEEENTEKAAEFKNDRQLFRMAYIGCAESESEERHFSKSKNPAALLNKVLTRAIDKNIAQLQHDYEPFRIKAPLISTDPLKAYVGMKEDVSEKKQYEVIERILNDDGSISYERVGIIRPVENKIWDNRYMSYEDDCEEERLKATEFEIVSGNGFYAGMLIREIR